MPNVILPIKTQFILLKAVQPDNTNQQLCKLAIKKNKLFSFDFKF